MILIIAEKPSVGRDIAAVVGADRQRTGCREGNGYLVSWCVGHLISPAVPETYDPALQKWTLDTLPILPEHFQFSVTEKTQTQFQRLQSLMNRTDVDSLICATDAGREGENIFRLVYQAAGCKKPWKRLWTNSLEADAIRVALEQMKDGHEYDHLADAARCRQEADWLFGINLTRLYTCLYGTRLNTGRVQSPTLAMLVQRQERIDRFSPTPYYIVTCRLADRLEVQHRFDSSADTEAFLSTRPKKAVITKVSNGLKSIASPHLFDLVSLQQEANRLFGYTAAQTLADMQVLYEAHLATYPRTDSRYITDDMEAPVQRLTVSLRAAGLLPKATDQMDFHRLVNNSKVSDHPALLPTAALTLDHLNSLPTSQRRLMILLLYRLLEATAPAYQCYTTEVEAVINGETFVAQEIVPWEAGWKQWRDACITTLGLKRSPKEAAAPVLSGMEEGIQLSITDTRQEKQMTKPPKPYTEASLLAAMETAGRTVDDDTLREAMRGKGLGTAATRAAIIESLVSNRYIMRKGRSLIPTEKANTYMSVLIDRLKDPIMTAQWEVKLLDIERGTGDPEQFIAEIRAFLSLYISDVKRFYRPELYENVFPLSAKGGREIVGKCPRCGGSVMDYPNAYSCSNYRINGCKFSIWKEKAGKQLSANVARCLLEKGTTDKLKGFHRKNGTTFDATLVLRDNGAVDLV